MSDTVILVPVDGASNIKLEALDFDTLTTSHSAVTESPTAEHEGLACNATGDEFDWFDEAIRALPQSCRRSAAIAPVARGCSGGMLDAEGQLTEVPGERLTLAYTHRFPEAVEVRFRELVGPEDTFFAETGSIRDFPGSLTLLKRFVFEEMMRPDVVERAEVFSYYGALMAGHFCGDMLEVARQAGNEHSYWMCHSGARDVTAQPGTPSRAASKIAAFLRFVPRDPAVAYRPAGRMPAERAQALGLIETPQVVPGGHDTALSHIPIMSTFYQAFPEKKGTPVIHVEAGTWTLIAQVGGTMDLPSDGYRRDIIVQGTVDGEPVATARYGGGADFAVLSKQAQSRGTGFDSGFNEQRLRAILETASCFVLPNVNPDNRGTGPFPEVEGRIIDEQTFFGDASAACIVTNLMTAMTTAEQIEAIAQANDTPLVLTAGGAKDPYFGRLLGSLTARPVYVLHDRSGAAITETTTLGAAIVGKAACLEVHPYEVDMTPLGAQYKEVQPLAPSCTPLLENYRRRWRQQL